MQNQLRKLLAPTGLTAIIAQITLPKSDVEKKFSAQGLIGKIISEFLPVVLGIAGFITVIVIIISGIQFITSGGNPEAAAAARGRLTFAVIGFVIIILAFAILQIVDKIFLGNSGVV
ncbi:hypothetical protein A2697_04950 [Candidatus Curtissbacteria bacterium RIFCSPHIGHO2_01_FULL_41_44]|uniref:Uncharacterized protein n=1 Tax=Candidatus Curtissbacteria bacterium RIFCSPLOWO2_01_FULL_42_50 TaxID=1797730 RepID=A0A1F5H639_9BACT|nr:MAG: hypothetical protein A3C33_00400 [Candidatus Curtissbacteria bacterium RIFCSPHIGHO2_02_FULL_42_58]OGD93992.1 MAG: hypothetical protein A2697_04950 [Candidatus Curtissbacteria bacterium RIFCSPHIGHO2_01_FULL_41_44]OGD97598.1 MAG: hypothetical protein A3E71_05255 [Candidatus Curtissbacteria bacterium RIFCSPHIGHO2_12_FULL_42_33]OGD99590.1 MAG: hypothetical protein A3B54_02460 [Candidatus Curtissbacteria bacterium RIFCSPLOWO2_01_FULL_42_50]OGE02570.1 MAG: hypothetical protein A3G16_03510 [Ca